MAITNKIDLPLHNGRYITKWLAETHINIESYWEKFTCKGLNQKLINQPVMDNLYHFCMKIPIRIGEFAIE